MAFRGWPEAALDFYAGLEADNSKTYWTAHRAVYEEQVLGPMLALLDELPAELGDRRVFRPYRDLRFSADKSPYKTHLGATCGPGYIQLSAAGLAAGTGMYHMAPDQLERYRAAVAADRSGEELAGMVAALARQKIDVHGTDPLKTAPKGYPKDHPRVDLLKNRGLIAWKSWPPAAWLGTARAKQRVVEFLRTSEPLGDWLETNVGATTMDESPARGRRGRSRAG